MTPIDPADVTAVLLHLRSQVAAGNLRVTQHAQQEMVNDAATLDDVLSAVANGQILENYPTHKRGACCLVHGSTATGRHLHVVCTSVNPVLIIITVYEPTPPVWPTPTQRRSAP